MSLHKFFTEAVKKYNFDIPPKAKTDINEAYGMEKSTRNNILPSIFSGEYGGVRVPSALKDTSKVPFWGAKYATYPFVAIEGYSETPTQFGSVKGREHSFINDKLGRISTNDSVKNILRRQISSNPNAIPGGGTILFPDFPISVAGSRANSRDINKAGPTSLSVLTSKNTSDTYRQGIYPLNVQQALSIDDNGKLYPNDKKDGGIVLVPYGHGRGIVSDSSKPMCMISPLRREDLISVAGLDNPKKFCDDLTGTGGGVGGLLLIAIRNGRLGDGIANNANPTYGDLAQFLSFIGMKDTSEAAVSAMIPQIRNLIINACKTKDGQLKIVDKLIIPYLLKSNFDSTYCLRPVPSDVLEKHSNDVAVYQALLGEGSFEDTLKQIYSDEDYFDFDDENTGEESDSEIGESISVSESSEDTPNVNNESLAANLMVAIRRFIQYPMNTTISFSPKTTVLGSTRENGDVITSHEGLKKTFIRFITSDGIEETDENFLKGGFSNGEVSTRGTLDYSPLFEKYKELFRDDMPRKFKYYRFVGYMISVPYSPEIEEAAKKSAHGRVRGSAMFREYMSRNNELEFVEPTIFDLIYIKGGDGYGDFIFSGYDKKIPKAKQILMGDAIPEEIISNGLIEDPVVGLHSYAVHDVKRRYMHNAYNKRA